MTSFYMPKSKWLNAADVFSSSFFVYFLFVASCFARRALERADNPLHTPLLMIGRMRKGKKRRKKKEKERNRRHLCA
jgi:hypothetical protein